MPSVTSVTDPVMMDWDVWMRSTRFALLVTAPAGSCAVTRTSPRQLASPRYRLIVFMRLSPSMVAPPRKNDALVRSPGTGRFCRGPHSPAKGAFGPSGETLDPRGKRPDFAGL